MSLFIISVFLIFSSQSFAQEPLFLTQQELQRLTPEKRGQYFREVQRILAAMAQQSLYLSEKDKSTASRLPARADQLVSPDDLLERTYLETGNGQGFSIRLENTPARSNLDPAPQSAPAPAPTPASAPSAPPQAATPPPQTTTPPQKVDVVETSADEGKVDNSRPQFRCMYAGWVIPEDPCVGHTRFPRYYSVEGTDAQKMVCSQGKTMCNPTVFGLQLPKGCKKLQDCSLQATPICVNRGAWPTVECYHSSTYENALVAAEINTEINPQHYETYSKVFTDLCDSEQIAQNPYADPKRRKSRKHVSADAIRNDIRVTCAWAEKKLRQVRSAMSEGSSYTKEKWQQQQNRGAEEMRNSSQK